MGIKGTETITIERKVFGPDDEYGNPVLNTEQITVNNCLIAWTSTDERADIFGVSVAESASVLLPAGTAVQSTDTFILPNDERYSVDGRPAYWHGQVGFSKRKKTLVAVKRVEGSSNG